MFLDLHIPSRKTKLTLTDRSRQESPGFATAVPPVSDANEMGREVRHLSKCRLEPNNITRDDPSKGDGSASGKIKAVSQAIIDE